MTKEKVRKRGSGIANLLVTCLFVCGLGIGIWLNINPAPKGSLAHGVTGNGSQESPYILTSVDDILTMQTKINDEGDSSWTDGWIELGASFSWTGDDFTGISSFYGNFDGKGFTISNLRVVTVSSSGQPLRLGFIRSAYGATISNLNISYSSLSRENATNTLHAGGIVGTANSDTQIINCSTSGTILASTANNNTAFTYVGGIAGSAYSNTKIIGCRSSMTITGSVNNSQGIDAGGIVGVAFSGAYINSCYSTGKITASGIYSIGFYAGGIVGRGSSSSISNCYSTGDVSIEGGDNSSASYGAGGIAGNAQSSAKISNCYSAGNITCFSPSENTHSAGGIVGNLISSALVTMCYATGNVSATASNFWAKANAGGLIGSINDASVTNSVALNNKINTVSGEGTTAQEGRIYGSVTSGQTISNNYALSTMQNTAGGTFTAGTHDSQNGANTTAAGAQGPSLYTTAANWQNNYIWNSVDWSFPAGQYPQFAFNSIELNISNCAIDANSFFYTSSPIRPKLLYNGQELTLDVHYTQKITSNNTAPSSAGTDAGTVEMEYTGRGKYTGTVIYTYSIAQSAPNPTTPNIFATQNQLLSELSTQLSVTNNTNETNGTWAWANPSVSVGKNAGIFEFEAIYTSIAASRNYTAQAVHRMIPITVEPTLFNKNGSLSGATAKAIKNAADSYNRDAIFRLFPDVGSADILSLSRLSWKIIYVNGDEITLWATSNYSLSIFNPSSVSSSLRNNYSNSEARTKIINDYDALLTAMPAINSVINQAGRTTNNLVATDRMWLPSMAEVQNSGTWGLTANTQRAYTAIGDYRANTAWLRSPSSTSGNVQTISPSGSVSTSGIASTTEYALRPALTISYAALQTGATIKTDFISQSSAASRISINDGEYVTEHEVEIEQGEEIIIKINAGAGSIVTGVTINGLAAVGPNITFFGLNTQKATLTIVDIEDDLAIAVTTSNSWQVWLIDEFNPPSTITVDGSYASLPTPAIPPSKTFAGWFNDKGEQVTAATVYSNITNWDSVERIDRVYARWI